MRVELKLNQVIIQPQEMEHYPNLLSSLQSYLPVPKTKKRRRTKKKRIQVSTLIDPILDSIKEE